MDEKRPLLEQESNVLPPANTRSASASRRQGRFGIIAVLLLCLTVSLCRHLWFQTTVLDRQFRQYADPPAPIDFDWEKAPSRPYLDYATCYGEFQCARLELPMDYFNATTNATISLAVIRRPAAVPVTHPQYGGPILFNPGGPGGSGIGLILSAGAKMAKFLDSEDGKYFDAVSFDPRGVGATRPKAECSQNQRLAQSFALRVMEEGVLGSSDASFGRIWAMSKARSASCSLPPADGSPDIKEYLSTASVARDMVELVEAHGAWRENEARRLSSSVSPDLIYRKGEEKLQYWGFSYGTYLGLTYAAMFPDRVSRLVVDGVVDVYDYKKTLWFDNLVDTEKDMDLLYYHCARVGHPTCALANETGDTTMEGVRQRVRDITMSLFHNPLPVIGNYPEVIEYSDVKNLIFAALYSPVQSFPYVANLLSDIEKGNGTLFAQLLKPYHGFDCPKCTDCSEKHEVATSLYALRNVTQGSTAINLDDAMHSILCSDGDDQSELDRAHFKEYFDKLDKLSPSIGAMWSTVRMNCVHYSIRAKHRFEGPWKGNTSHPILLVGNTADPVTPLRNAIKLAKAYEGAVALTQDSGGHCTTSAPSECSRNYIKQYFQTGQLPPANTTCKADVLPFGPDIEQIGSSAGVEDSGDDWASLNAAMYAAGGGFMRPGGLKRIGL